MTCHTVWVGLVCLAGSTWCKCIGPDGRMPSWFCRQCRAAHTMASPLLLKLVTCSAGSAKASVRGAGTYGVPRASAVCSTTPVAMAWLWHTARLWPQQRAEAVAMAAHTTPTGHSIPFKAGLKLTAPVAMTTGRQPRRLRAAQPSQPQRHGAPLAMVELPSSHCSAHRRLILHLRSGGILTRTQKHTQQRRGGARFWLAASSRGRRCWQVRLWQSDISRGSLRLPCQSNKSQSSARFMRSGIEKRTCCTCVRTERGHCAVAQFALHGPRIFQASYDSNFHSLMLQAKQPRILARQVRAQGTRLSLSRPTQCAFGSKKPLVTTFADWRRGLSAGDSQLLPIAVCAVQSAWREQEHYMRSATCKLSTDG